jgi:Predicted integral membrane protein
MKKMTVLLLLYLLTVALSAGIYFIFSNTIIKSLSDFPSELATKTMQKINQVIQNPFFLIIFFGPLLLGSTLSWHYLAVKEARGRLWILLSFLTYFLGVFLITVIFNVPMNNKLDNNTDGSYWPYYMIHWTRFNTLRFLCCLLTIIFLFLGLIA